MLFDKIIHFNEIDSTNLFLSRLTSKQKIKENLVVTADFQTKGKAQGEKKWNSTKKKNLLFSLYIHDHHFDLENKSYINYITLLALINTLENYVNDFDIKIKKPNDILVKGGKISGVLIETKISSQKINSIIIGIGLNINQKKFLFKENNPTSLFKLINKELNREEVLNIFLKNFNELYNHLVKKDHEKIKDKYLNYIL
ncbi:MAG: biotin--[acetyl-CoA-carboxylase] ligase [Bacteroidota bacterium]|nr:biotin--[acetyl-CoA-carboxylase] ligase [Bacteroidota bacterium]